MAESRPDRWEMDGSRIQRVGRVVLPGLYAWLTTAAIPAVAGGRLLAIAAAGSALCCLLAGVGLWRRRPAQARAVGILGFVGLCIVSWVVASFGDTVGFADTPRSAVGAVAWGLFALGWGGLGPSSEWSIPGTNGSVADAGLQPRNSVPTRIVVGWVILCASALLFPAMAWRIDDPVDALLGQVLAAVAAIAVLASGTTVLFGREVDLGRRRWGTLVFGCLWVLSGIVFAPFEAVR